MKIRVLESGEIRQDLLTLDIAFVIDTTGSMGREIAEVQKRLKELAEAIVSHALRPRARFAVIGYRDHPPMDQSYVSRIYCGLDPSLKSVQDALNAMKAHGGGDGPEAVVDGVKDALHLQWNKSSQKTILLVGDSPPHGNGSWLDYFPKGCPCGQTLLNLAAEITNIGITGHAVGVRSNKKMVESFSEFAKSAGGVFVHLDRLSDLIPTLMKRIGEEMEKIATDLRTIEKIKAGGDLSSTDLESIERLAKKGVRILPSTIASNSNDRGVKLRRRIRIIS